MHGPVELYLESRRGMCAYRRFVSVVLYPHGLALYCSVFEYLADERVVGSFAEIHVDHRVDVALCG